MRFIVAAAKSLACCALLLDIAQASPARDSARITLAPGDVWIRDVTLISSERPEPLPHAHLVVRGEHIAYVGVNTPGGRTSGVTVIKGVGRYLVPGLIDGHVHLSEVPGISSAAAPALAEAYYRQLPRSYVYFGFTAVVDLNIVDREKVEQVRKADTGPAVFDCGNALALANGYPMSYLPPAVRFERYPNFLYDPRQADSIPPRYSPQEHSPEAAIQRIVAGGGICVKGHYEPGFDPNAGKLPVPTVELMRRVAMQATSACHFSSMPTRSRPTVSQSPWEWMRSPMGCGTGECLLQEAAGSRLRPSVKCSTPSDTSPRRPRRPACPGVP